MDAIVALESLYNYCIIYSYTFGGDVGSLLLFAIQGPITGVLWSEQDNWGDRGQSSYLFVRIVYTNQFTEEEDRCDCSKAICTEG
jgi:hypothetical protein